MTRDEGRQASRLRGRLAEIFLPSLLSDDREPLAIRLGERATLAFPWSKPAVGLAAVKQQLESEAAWLAEIDAQYNHLRTLVGHDRDVAEGTISARVSGRSRDLRVAVLCVRKPAREVDVRVFIPAASVGRTVIPSAIQMAEGTAVPEDVSTHLGAIRFGDASQILDTFETEATVLDANGDAFERKSGALRTFYESRLPVPQGSTTWVPVVRGVTDTGRVVAIEYETSGTGRLGLLVLERGESGLFREARIYDDVAGPLPS